MRLARFNGGRIGLLRGDAIVDVTDLVSVDNSWPPTAMVRTIARFDTARPELLHALESRPSLPLEHAVLDCPIDWPNKIIAFPANYHAHIDEMREANALISARPASGQGFFLKANSSLSGPSDAVVLPPIPDREVHHECELAIIVGRGGRGIARENAMAHIFGYACLIDFVVRGTEERVMRKSFDGFCPVGPHIVTADEIPDPANLDLRLSVNGELRQSANTRDLIVDIPGMISMASSVMTLFPGDVIASGTPAGVGPVAGGDRIDIEIDHVGAMSLQVVQGDIGGHPLWAAG